MTRVMIVEDQVLTSQLYELKIKNNKRFQVVRTITNADLALFYVEEDEIELILMDVCTDNDASGLEASKRIKEKYPDVKIIITTSMPEFSWIERAKDIGVDSFWYKNVSKESLLEIMTLTMQGNSIYPETTPELTFGETTNHHLTYRELEILKELTTGDSNSEIGKRLGISANTVRNSLQVIMEKTGFKSRTELAVEARRLGIVIKDKN